MAFFLVFALGIVCAFGVHLTLRLLILAGNKRIGDSGDFRR